MDDLRIKYNIVTLTALLPTVLLSVQLFKTKLTRSHLMALEVLQYM